MTTPATPPAVPASPPVLSAVMHRNIQALLAVRQERERQTSREQRFAGAIARWAGSLWSAYLHAALFSSWIVVNLGLIPGLRPVDPFPFVMLAMFASVEAIFLSTFVLISQNRSAAIAEERADLDVQINLLAEHEITHLVRQLDAVAEKLGVRIADSGVEDLKKDVDPTEVVQGIQAASQTTD